jgi:CRP/FNR family transcriptional regulator/CRP/FNR family cyclic AMP-dependent transcriptional regulator
MMEVQLFKGIPLFEGLSDRELEAIAALVVTRRFGREQVIFLAEEEGDAMFVIQNGRVKISLISDDGREIILDILRKGDFFGEMSLLDGHPRSATVVAIEETELAMLRRSDFLQLVQRVPQIATKLLAELATRLRRADQKIEHLALLDVTGRILKTLMQMGERHGVPTEEGMIILNRPTHQDLANMVGTTRETASRILKRLERKGYLKYQEKTLVLLNRLNR